MKWRTTVRLEEEENDVGDIKRRRQGIGREVLDPQRMSWVGASLASVLGTRALLFCSTAP